MHIKMQEKKPKILQNNLRLLRKFKLSNLNYHLDSRNLIKAQKIPGKHALGKIRIRNFYEASTSVRRLNRSNT